MVLVLFGVGACSEEASIPSATTEAGAGGGATLGAGGIAPAAGRPAADGGGGAAAVPSVAGTAADGLAGGAGAAAPVAGRDNARAGAGATAPAAGRGGAGGASNAGSGGAMDGGDSAGAAGGAAPGDAARAYAPCPAADVCRILPLGDSITFGIGYAGGYRVELFRRARADGKKITFTGSLANGPTMVEGAPFPRNNEGHSGWKIDQLVPLVPMPAFQTVPHIVLLMIGTNDIAQNDDLANAPARLGALIDTLVMHAPDALIVVAKITPLGRSNAIQNYNAAIPTIVEARASAGKHVMLIDQFTDFPTSELGDGVHPNRQGYERMARVWYDAIGPLLR